MPHYSVHLHNDLGRNLVYLSDVLNVHLVHAVNGVGGFALTFPESTKRDLFRVDNIVELWRFADTVPNYGRREMVGLIRKITTQTDQDRIKTRTISGPDGNDLLNRRIIAYASGTANAEKTNQADDVIKAVVRENLGTSAIAARQASGLTVQIDLGAGVSVTKAMSWMNLLDVCRDLAESSYALGTPVYFEVIPSGASGWQLVTHINQPGIDRTVNNRTVFSMAMGNLYQPVMVEDYTEEVTYVYAGGDATGSLKQIVEVEDVARSNRSRWGRREAFVDARYVAGVDIASPDVTQIANQRLEEGRPRRRFSGYLLDTPNSRYGINWAFGDKVIVFYDGYNMKAIVKSVEIEWDKQNGERLTATCEADEVIR